MEREIFVAAHDRVRSGIRKGPRESTEETRKNIPTGGWGLTCKYTTKCIRAQINVPEWHCKAKRLLP